ncbi:MAG TPA: DUF3775 domain-containing protein [Alphaproteobacteria bacterium]
MLNAITFAKVDEIIGLVERACRAPDERSDDPRRGGPSGDRGVARAAPPMEPQPAPDWSHAVTRYLDDLADEALAEVVALYHFGRGDYARVEDAVADARRRADTHRQKAADLAARPDLAACLRVALAQR